jgi:pimeloyl-ACP methyl ester carboxylesterase
MLRCVTDELLPSVAPSLEVLDEGSPTAAHPVPLLFIHGAWHAAWCWVNFLDFFAAKGYRALAVSLRGHGSSAPSTRRRGASFTDYIADVESVVATLDVPPVVIGHSMGGLIVQKYLESNDAPAGVLIASGPPQGAGGFAMRLARRHPWLLVRSTVTGNGLHGFNTPEVARALFYSAGTPQDDVVRYAARLCNESQRVSLDTMWRYRIRPELISTPLLVVGAELDACITRSEVHDTARAFGTDAQFFPMGHNMMLEPGWTDVAQRIADWLAARRL